GMPVRLADVQALQRFTKADWPRISADDAVGTRGRPKIQNLRLLTGWLYWQALFQASKNKPVEALELARLMFEISRCESTDIEAIYFLVRCAQDRFPIRALERTLAQCNQIPPAELALTRRKVEDEAVRLQLTPALIRERAWAYHIMAITSNGW